MAADPQSVVEFKAGGKKRRLYFGIRAEKAVESHYDLPFLKAVQKIMPDLKAEDLADAAKVAEASAGVRFTDIAKLFEFALLKFEPNIAEAEVEDLIDEIGLASATELMGQALNAALGAGEGGEGAAGNPRPASQKKRTGSRSK